MVRLCLLMALLVLACAAHAEVYRCQADGRVLFTDHECTHGHGEEVDLGAANLSVGSHMVTPDMAAMAEQYTQRMQALAAARTAQRQRRQVAGMTCPLNSEIAAAIQAQRVVLCMTPAEVTAAQPRQDSQPDVQGHPLPNGLEAQEWLYTTSARDWPAVVQFRSGYVIGYGSAPPRYDWRPRPYVRHYYWPRHAHAGKPPPFDPELYRPQLPTIIDPPSMNAYPATGASYHNRYRPHEGRHSHRRGHHRDRGGRQPRTGP